MNAAAQTPAMVIAPTDNVAVALVDLAAGQTVQVAGRTVKLTDAIPCAHKFAVEPIAADRPVVKYGHPIGHATAAISPGQWVHVHNLRTNLSGAEQYSYAPALNRFAPINDGLTFEGFLRPDGQAGVRNEIWILPTVGCVNNIAQQLAEQFRKQPCPGVDAIFPLNHPYGCSQLGDDLANTRKILAALARHPNAAGVLIVGLGCENNTMEEFRRELGDASPERFRFMISQQVGDEMQEGLRLLGELAEYASQFRRQSLPVSQLRIGLKCGGSDAFSGITANPLLGLFSDELIRRGGTTVLTETPEMFGAEPLFMNRCADDDVFNACANMLNEFKRYFLSRNQPVYENPAPGNKQGGISTLEEKSLGCLQKGGTTNVVDVLPYAGRLSKPGLNFLAAPGNDIVSVTALAAAGAQMVFFTTGRGTPLGGPLPTIKISSNSALAESKPHWIDFDAGRLLGGSSLPELAAELVRETLEIASGRRLAKNEINAFREIAIFKDGVTL